MGAPPIWASGTDIPSMRAKAADICIYKYASRVAKGQSMAPVNQKSRNDFD
jgi:hypothetical protein